MNQTTLISFLALAASIGCGESTMTAVIDQSVVNACQRKAADLSGPERECVDDLDCPCGSHCGDNHVCTYSCMPAGWPAPPPNPPEGSFTGDATPCPSSSVCDDTGRCVSLTDPAATTVLLSADPPTLTTVAGGASKPVNVRLRLTDSAPAVVEAAESAVVRVVAREGAEVSCNGIDFDDHCSLTDWSFTLNGQALQASKQVRVRTKDDTAEGHGDIVLAVEPTGAPVVVPAAARTPRADEEGQYAGIARSSAYPSGLRVTAIARGHQLLVREASRAIAPDGALLLDIKTDAAPTARRKMVWVRDPAAADTAGAVVGDYIAGKSTVDLEKGTLNVPLSLNVPGSIGLDAWTLELTRFAETAPECDAATPCATGSECRPELKACVPTSVWTPTAAPIGNALVDARADAWWNKVSPMLSGPAMVAAFNTTGAALVESMLCSTDASHRGWLTGNQVRRDSTAPSRSGDLDCMMAAGTDPNALVKTQSPGAVGFATLADRVSADAELRLEAVHATCMVDLTRSPPTGDFSSHFSATVASCANLSRFLPALRLLATDPLTRGTASPLEPRTRGLTVRLTQQWATLQAFLATISVAKQSYASFASPTPSSAARTQLTKALDAIDLGWTALIDKNIGPMVRNAVRWSPSADNEAIRDQSRDYRSLRQPIVYWTFPSPSSATPPPVPTRDIVRGVDLIPQGNLASMCVIHAGTFAQGFNCPGYYATLPADAPSLVDDASLGGAGQIDNLTVTLNVDARDNGGPGTTAPSTLVAGSDTALDTGHDTNACPSTGCDPPPGGGDDPPPTPPPPQAPPYRGGTLLATPTLAIAESVQSGTLASTLVLAHPTAGGGVEITTFTGYGTLGTLPDDPVTGSTTIAVVRDAKAKTYTLYVWQPAATAVWKLTKPYSNEPSGTLDWVPAKTIRVGAAVALTSANAWYPYRKAYGGYFDDIAVFDAALSEAEVTQFSAARGFNASRRAVWPFDLAPPAPGNVTQEVTAPVGALLLEAQVAELELAGRFMAAMQDRAQLACEVDPTSQTAIAARAEIAAAVARVGRILRRGHMVEWLAAGDIGERATAARQQLAAKRLEIARASEPTRCTQPFQMADDEVPLYHDTIPEGMGETDAFFAASGFLQNLALQHANLAMSKRTAAETAYANARASQIQQVEADNVRADRLLGIKNQYGDVLRRLCGLAHQTNEDFVHDNFEAPDPAHPFAVESCYVVPTAACLAQRDRPLAEVDASCYRGELGEHLMNLRAAYYAQQAGYQSWKAASDNAEAANRFCVWKQMDSFGCVASDHDHMTDVHCPIGPDGQPVPVGGTLQLIQAFNDELADKQKERAIVTGLIGTFGEMVSGISSGPSGVIGGMIKGASSGIGAAYDVEIQNRQREHDLMLSNRAALADAEACWNQADQYERATRGAEMASQQALAQFQAAGIGFSNGVAEAEQQTIELRAALAREATRPVVPIAFHYWLGEAISAYETELETARRYTYLALRATEYDMQDSYKTPAGGKPLRSAVLGATHPQQLLDQLTLLQAQTNQRMLNGRRPARNHLTFDFGEWQWGLPVGAPLTAGLDARLRRVFDKNGVYLGMGLRFSFVPQRDDEAPVWRCAERIWRVAVATSGFPLDQPNYMVSKLIKRNTFASRRCGVDGMQVARWRSKVNLFVATGEESTPDFDDPLPAHTPLIYIDNILDEFRNRDDAYNNSSRELSLQGLYGDYVLLFPKEAIAHGLVPRNLHDLNIRFDYLSVDDTPPIQMLRGGAPARPGEIHIDSDPSPITLD